jgi:hypothetical protein
MSRSKRMSSTVCRARNVAVPAEPLQPPQLRADLVGEVAWRLVWGLRVRRRSQALGHVGHDGDPHRQVEPVQQVLGLGGEVRRQVADVFATVGEEGDLLVGGHPLGSEHLEQAPFGFRVVGLPWRAARRRGWPCRRSPRTSRRWGNAAGWSGCSRRHRLSVPKTSSTSCDQVIFVYQATDASLSSDAVTVEIDRFG